MLIITINWNVMKWKPILAIKVVAKSSEIAFMTVSVETRNRHRQKVHGCY